MADTTPQAARLTQAQREFLQVAVENEGAYAASGHIRRTAEALSRRGLIRYTSGSWWAATPAGLTAVRGSEGDTDG